MKIKSNDKVQRRQRDQVLQCLKLRLYADYQPIGETLSSLISPRDIWHRMGLPLLGESEPIPRWFSRACLKHLRALGAKKVRKLRRVCWRVGLTVERQRWLTCIHEASHAVFDAMGGFKVLSVGVFPVEVKAARLQARRPDERVS